MMEMARELCEASLIRVPQCSGQCILYGALHLNYGRGLFLFIRECLTSTRRILLPICLLGNNIEILIGSSCTYLEGHESTNREKAKG